MRIWLWMFVLGFALLKGGLVHAEETTRFFSSLPDMPLMEGLTELEDQTIIFDKPEGRIVESVALMDHQSPGDVLQYYKDTLPQLGWARIGDQVYKREQEFLTLTAEAGQGGHFLRLRIAPAQQ